MNRTNFKKVYKTHKQSVVGAISWQDYLNSYPRSSLLGSQRVIWELKRHAYLIWLL